MLAAVYPKRDNPITELYEVADEPVFVGIYRATTYKEIVRDLKKAIIAAERLSDEALVGVAYETDEPNAPYENNSHAVACIEWDKLRERWDYWHLHEIPGNVARF